jgi:hypothetical protein
MLSIFLWEPLRNIKIFKTINKNFIFLSIGMIYRCKFLSEIKYQLTPYGIWYYGDFFDRLVGKLENALKPIFYSPPDVKSELETLSKFKSIEGFEDIGKEIEEWKNWVTSQYLDASSCRRLYEASIHWRETFRERVNEFFLIKPKLQMLNAKVIIKTMRDLPEDAEVKEWLQEESGRVAEFREGCRALLSGLSTAAGFYFIRLCERALRDLYKRETGKDVERKTWGIILDELESYYQSKGEYKVLELISYLKKSRDQIAHPEQLLTQQEAEELYAFTIRVIREIKRELKRIK